MDYIFIVVFLVETSGVRPVINLSNEVRFNGNGTVSNIYTIS